MEDTDRTEGKVEREFAAMRRRIADLESSLERMDILERVARAVSSGLNLLGVSNFLTIAIWGMIIILVFVVNYLTERYRERRQAA